MENGLFIKQVVKPVVVDTRKWVEEGRNIEDFPALKENPELFELVKGEDLPKEYDVLNYATEAPIEA